MSAKDKFLRFLDENDIEYEDKTEESFFIDLPGDENISVIDCVATIRDTDDGRVLVSVSHYGLPKPADRLSLLQACVASTADSFYGKFYVDDDDDIVADFSMIYADFSPYHLYRMMLMFSDDVDVAYGIFRKAAR